MPEPIKIDNSTNADKGSGTDPIKTDASKQETFDTSKIGDGDFEKVFDDPRVWKHPRFKTLNERAKKADEYESQQQKAKEEQLAKDKKWEELATLRENEAKTAREEVKTAKVDNSIQIAIAKAGVVDLEAGLKLIDRAKVVVAEDGTITGVDEAVKSLLETRPYLKGNSSVTIGGGTNPGVNSTDQLKRYKLSQLQDPVFYRENEKDIMASMKAGLVEDDLTR